MCVYHLFQVLTIQIAAMAPHTLAESYIAYSAAAIQSQAPSHEKSKTTKHSQACNFKPLALLYAHITAPTPASAAALSAHHPL